VRVLFAFVGGNGHCERLVPIAIAAETAGHTAAFTCRPSMVPVVETIGFAAYATGPGNLAFPRYSMRCMQRRRRCATR
jgi:UDP:flavonoid glycosyltransferase YjiC (YdhE family)